jgi:hypothetical protein
MKPKFILILFTILTVNLKAQTWSGATPGNIYYNSGNVGIGTSSSPSEKLEINSIKPAVRIGDSQDVSTFGNTFTEMSSIKFYHHYNTLIGAKMYTIKKYSGGMSWGGTDLRFAVSNVANNSISDAMTINYLGNVGVGTTDPSEKLEIESTSPSIKIGDNRDVSTFGSTSTEMSSIKFYHHYNTVIGAKIYTIKKYSEGMSWGGTDLRFAVSNVANNSISDAMTINYLGNILVGKTSQINSNYKLDVNGSIRSNEIVVNTTGADFVFEKEYRLRDLDDLEKYIATNKHLPDIEPAKEMEKNGLELGKMDMKLLQKIEELTLYLIDFKKEMDKLKEENQNLRARMVNLEKD